MKAQETMTTTTMFWCRVTSLFLRTYRSPSQIGKCFRVPSQLLTSTVSSLVYPHNTITPIPPASSLYLANFVPSDYPPLTESFQIHLPSSPGITLCKKNLEGHKRSIASSFIMFDRDAQYLTDNMCTLKEWVHSSQELKQHHSETVHVTLYRQLPSHEVLWIQISLGIYTTTAFIVFSKPTCLYKG